MKNEYKNKTIESENTLSKCLKSGDDEIDMIIFDNSPEAIILLDKKGNIEKLNNRLYDWLGYKPDDIFGMHLLQVPFLGIKTKTLIMKKFALRMLGKDVAPYDIDFISKNGESKIGRVRAAPIKDEKGKITGDLVFISDVTKLKDVMNELEKAKDRLEMQVDEQTREILRANEKLRTEITEHKQAEEALQKSETRYRTLLENLPQNIFMKDNNSIYVTCNDNFARDLGITPDEITGKTDFDFFPKELAEKYRIDDKRIMESGKTEEIDEEYFIEGKERIVHTVKVPFTDENGNYIGVLSIFWDITALKQLEKERTRLVTAIEQAEETVVITDRNGNIQYVNPIFERITGYLRDEVIGKNSRILKSGKHDDNFYRELWDTISQGEVWSGKIINQKKDGTFYYEDTTISPVKDESDTITNYVAVKRDVTKQMALESQLRQAHKLESIGQLASGIAHEINTPIQFIGDNVQFLEEGMQNLLKLTNTYTDLLHNCEQGNKTNLAIEKSKEAEEEIDLEYLKEEIPSAISQTNDGLGRVSKIVGAMKDFSRIDSEEKILVDINKTIESTIIVSRNEWKYVADMKTDFDQTLPLVSCFSGEINQVVMNLIINASHAIADVKSDGSNGKGLIAISTRREGNFVSITVSDTGPGIPEDIRDKVFNPFFTTKEVGKGTGQGLSLAYASIVERHSGKLSFETETGEGTTFKILLPI